MTSRIAFLDPAVARYIEAHSRTPTEVEQRLIAETQAMPNAGMQIGVPQGDFMAQLTRIMAPKTVVEIGVFTGYSALRVAQELDEDALLLAFDISEEWTAVAQRHWEQAGVSDRIELHLGPAAENLAKLPEGLVVDLAFIDADKTGYLEYLELLHPHLSGRSVVLVDNVLWDGNVAGSEDQSESTQALREFNHRVAVDPRFELALLPAGDGIAMITLAR